MIFYLLFIIALALFTLRVWRGEIVSRPLALLVASNLIFLALYYFVNALSGNGFDESVVYHLAAGLDDAGILAFAPLIAAVLAVISVCIFFAFYLSRRSINDRRHRGGRIVAVGLGAAFVGSLLVNPLVSSISLQFPLLQAAFFQRENLNDEIARFNESKFGKIIKTGVSGQPLLTLSVDLRKEAKNIIWIYAESLERTYFEEEVFGDLLANLSSQAKYARRYTSIDQPWGTGWTIGGIVGSQCGMPLVTLGAKNINSLTELDEFMPGAVCAGDLLSRLGYSLEFIGGASKEFAGKGNFLATHGFAEIQDRTTLRDAYDDGSVERNEWGYYDDLLLSVVKKRALSLHADGGPFFLNALTLDTHSPHGFVSPVCRAKTELARSTRVGSAIKCADYLLSDFIEWFRSSDLVDDTILVISSDHLSMPNDLQGKLEQVSDRRRLLFWMFGGDITAGTVDRPASTFDLGPTVLASAISNSSVSIGAGRNIEDRPSLYQRQFDDDDLAANIAGFQALAWRHVNGSSSIYMNASKQNFVMGGRSYPFPVLIEFVEGKFANLSWVEKARRERYVDLIKPDRSYVWIDRCGWSPETLYQGANGFCGHVLDRGYVVDSVPLSKEGTTQIRADRVEAALAESSVASAGLSVHEIDYAVSTSGPGIKAGVIGAHNVTGTRGLNVFKKAEGTSGWSLFRNIDLCDDAIDRPVLDGVRDLPEEQLLVVVKDTAHCGNVEILKAVAASMALPELASLQFRQPYVGIFGRGNGKPAEFVGEVGMSTIVALPQGI